ncbi:MAG: hypothetical protein OXI43_02500 [Candidatus Poribacteria bacterium]|nr:hypothetical protein [Candidatus Poribacteria bacterium]
MNQIGPTQLLVLDVPMFVVAQFINIDAQAVLEMNAIGVLPFTPLMKPPAGMDIGQNVQLKVYQRRLF